MNGKQTIQTRGVDRLTSILNVTDAKIVDAVADLSALRRHFTTSDVIRRIRGSFCSDRNTPAAASPNANFGKMLSANSDRFHIELVLRGLHTRDDRGNRTTTALWRAR